MILKNILLIIILIFLLVLLFNFLNFYNKTYNGENKWIGYKAEFRIIIYFISYIASVSVILISRVGKIFNKKEYDTQDCENEISMENVKKFLAIIFILSPALIILTVIISALISND